MEITCVNALTETSALLFSRLSALKSWWPVRRWGTAWRYGLRSGSCRSGFPGQEGSAGQPRQDRSTDGFGWNRFPNLFPIGFSPKRSVKHGETGQVRGSATAGFGMPGRSPKRPGVGRWPTGRFSAGSRHTGGRHRTAVLSQTFPAHCFRTVIDLEPRQAGSERPVCRGAENSIGAAARNRCLVQALIRGRAKALFTPWRWNDQESRAAALS